MTITLPVSNAIRWRLGDRFMLRAAGLPFEAVASLRFTETIGWADAILDGESRLTVAAARLSDLLHDAISGLINEEGREADRRVLLTLRRQVFNNKLPSNPATAVNLVATLSAPAAAALTEWLRERAAWEELLGRGPALMRAETEAARARLHALADDPKLRQGLLLASASLDAALDTYLGRGLAEPGKRERRTERALLEYVYRVAAKTSPFSTFTGVALGAFTEPGEPDEPGPHADPAADLALSIPEHWPCHPRVNVAVLARLAELIADDEALREDLPVALTAGWHADADRIRYVRFTTMHGDDDAPVSFDLVHDDVFFLRHGVALADTLELFAREPDLRYAEFISRLSSALGAPVGDCARYARKLLSLGLLRIPVLRIDIHHPDPLHDLAERLRPLRPTWARDLAGRLEAIAAEIDGYATADLPERRAILRRVRTRFEELHAALGMPDVTLPRTLVFEDARAGSELLSLDREQWTGRFAEPLRALGSVLPVFDLVLPHRLTLRGFFLARYGRGGRCEDLLKLVHEFHEDIYNQYLKLTGARREFDDQGRYLPQENWLRLPEFAALDDAREALAEHMRRLWARTDADTTEVVLDEAALSDLAGRMAPLATRFRPEGHFVQVGVGSVGTGSVSAEAADAGPDGEPLAVLNRSFGSLSFPFSRFTHCFEDTGTPGGGGLAGHLRRATHGAGPRDAVFAEITGGVANTNLNLHGRLTDYQIVGPDESCTRPPQEQLPLDDLYAVHDAATDRIALRSRRLGREVIPLYFGYLLPTALPDIPRTLLLFSPSSLIKVDLWGGVPEAPDVTGAPTPPVVTHRPRVRFRNIVLARQRWSIPAEALPVHRPEATDAERLLGWRRWQRTHGFPDRVFARFGSEGDRAKPYFVDFAGWLSVGLLETRLRAGGGVVFEEMSPTEDQLHVTSPAGRHVAELAVESVTWHDDLSPSGGPA